MHIYLDGSAALDPDVGERLAHLADAGHRLVLVAPDSHPATALASLSDRTTTLPAQPPRGSWFLTADPATCENPPRPTRCDSTARDLREAVLEILAADAMS